MGVRKIRGMGFIKKFKNHNIPGLVNIQKTMKHHHAMGKLTIIYFYGAIFNSYVTNYQRVYH